MSGLTCKALICWEQLGATSDALIASVQDFDEEKTEELIAIAEKSIHKLTEAALE